MVIARGGCPPRTMARAWPPSPEEWRHHEQEQQQQQHRVPPAPLPFYSVPEAMVVGITYLPRLRGAHAICKKVVTTISHRALFALPGESCPTDDDDCEVEEGEADDGACGGEDGADEDKHDVRLGQAVMLWRGGSPARCASSPRRPSSGSRRTQANAGSREHSTWSLWAHHRTDKCASLARGISPHCPVAQIAWRPLGLAEAWWTCSAFFFIFSVVLPAKQLPCSIVLQPSGERLMHSPIESCDGNQTIDSW